MDILGISGGYIGDIFGINWEYLRDIFFIFWGVLGISRGYLLRSGGCL